MVSVGSPPDFDQTRALALRALRDFARADPPRTRAEAINLFLSARTAASRSLPPYYLVYFLLVDLLGFVDLGQGEKVAWVVPIRFKDRLYSIQYAKFGLGIFAPNLDPKATSSGTPSAQNESDAREIAVAINKAVSVAEPYFEWRASQAASTSALNVVNACDGLFDRYVFFRDRFRSLLAEAERRRDEGTATKTVEPDGGEVITGFAVAYAIHREARWNAQAAIEAFFSWTEHLFIHIGILKGRLTSGDQVATLAGAEWKVKFKTAFDDADPVTKRHYDTLLELRAQLRNFMAHGAFGKRGEAFSFHSGAGAVPVLLTSKKRGRYTLSGEPAFDEEPAVEAIEAFIEHLWSGPRAPAKEYCFSGLPSILTYALDGTYARAMESVESMAEFVEQLQYQHDAAANMDW